MRKYIWLMACLVAFAPLSTNAAKKQKKAKRHRLNSGQTVRRWMPGSPMRRR